MSTAIIRHRHVCSSQLSLCFLWISYGAAHLLRQIITSLPSPPCWTETLQGRSWGWVISHCRTWSWACALLTRCWGNLWAKTSPDYCSYFLSTVVSFLISPNGKHPPPILEYLGCILYRPWCWAPHSHLLFQPTIPSELLPHLEPGLKRPALKHSWPFAFFVGGDYWRLNSGTSTCKA